MLHCDFDRHTPVFTMDICIYILDANSIGLKTLYAYFIEYYFRFKLRNKGAYNIHIEFMYDK